MTSGDRLPSPDSALPPSDVAPADVLLADGSVAVIRPMLGSDREALESLHDEADDESVRLRFFSLNRNAGRSYVGHLFEASEDTVLSLVATAHNRIVAVATAERTGSDSAEVAFLVSRDQQGHGVGSLLLEHLAAACSARGVRRFVAEVLFENQAMTRVFLDAGFEVSRRTEEGVVFVEMDTSVTPTVLEAADLREAQAEARSLAPLLYPSTVAVVGVRREGGGIGHAVLRSIVGGGFAGRLYVVHPKADAIEGVSAYPSFTDLPERVDVAIVAVPAERVLDALADAAEAKISVAVVISSGFSELGPRGAEIQSQMVRLTRENGIRLVGPNCLGVMSNDPDVRLNATFARQVPLRGGLGIASQSGGVGIAMLDVASEMGLGVAAFISLGNKADVSGNDLLAAWLDDSRVSAAALYLESFGNAPKFARLARRFAERKPVLAVVGGRSAGGRRAGASHTAAAASPSVGVDALFAQAGVIPCRNAESMARTALLLAEQPLPAGYRVAIVSNAGGLGVLAADAADVQGLVIPELSEGLRKRLHEFVSGTVGTSNPVDIGAGATAENIRGVLQPLLDSDEVDAVLVVLAATSVSAPEPLVEALGQVKAASPEKPLLLVAMGGMPRHAPGVTAFPSADDAVESLARAARYAEWLRTPRGEVPHTDVARADAARRLARDLRGGGVGADDLGGWLAAEDAARLLSPYGLQPVGEVVHTALSAGDAAVALGFPVAVKVADETVVHKTERGLVRVGLQSAAEVMTSVRAFEKELGRQGVPVLVQPMVAGVEVALGVVRDPGFGPLVMVAAGGVATNVWNDRAFLLSPVTERDAARAVASLRIAPLLGGYRGAERADVDDLVHRVVALGQLAADVPDIAELDLNPVMATPSGAVLVDVKVRLADPGRTGDTLPRQLRLRA